MTTLLSMTVSASAIIAAIIVIRSLFIHRLPKRLFVILWAIAALRMLVPFSFSVNIPHEIHSLKMSLCVNLRRQNRRNQPPEQAALRTVI